MHEVGPLFKSHHTCTVDAYAEAEGCRFLSLLRKVGGVTFSGEVGVLLLLVVFIKWEKISVCWSRYSNLLLLSSSCILGYSKVGTI